MTRKEILDQFDIFELAIFYLLEGYDLGVALAKDEMTADQRKRFDKIETVYIDEKLKDCPF